MTLSLKESFIRAALVELAKFLKSKNLTFDYKILDDGMKLELPKGLSVNLSYEQIKKHLEFLKAELDK